MKISIDLLNVLDWGNREHAKQQSLNIWNTGIWKVGWKPGWPGSSGSAWKSLLAAFFGIGQLRSGPSGAKSLMRIHPHKVKTWKWFPTLKKMVMFLADEVWYGLMLLLTDLFNTWSGPWLCAKWLREPIKIPALVATILVLHDPSTPALSGTTHCGRLPAKRSNGIRPGLGIVYDISS